MSEANRAFLASSGNVEDIDLNDEEESALERAWARLEKDGGHKSFAEADSGKDVALGGTDGRKVEALLSTSIRQGTKTLHDLTRAAVTRLLAQGVRKATSAKSLFNDAEKQQLADQLAATNATAELLGRVRIAERADEAERRAKQRQAFADFCGGKGGKPGPCPTGRAQRPSVARAKAVAIKPTVDALHAKVQGLVGKKLTAPAASELAGEMAKMRPSELQQLSTRIATSSGGKAKVAKAKTIAGAAIARAKANPKPVDPAVTKPTQTISERAATDPNLSYDEIKAHVAGLGKKSKGELTAIAKSVEVTPGSRDTKAVIQQKIEASLSARKGRQERTAVPDATKSEPPVTQANGQPKLSPEQVTSLHRDLGSKMPELNDVQTELVGDYTSGAYQEINGALREGRPPSKGAKVIPAMDKAIADAPTLDTPVTVYRGLRLNGEQGQKFLAGAQEAAKTGGIMRDPAFSSSTIDPDIATKWATGGKGAETPIVMEISARHGLYIGQSVGGTKEKEFIMGRNSGMRVLGVEDRGTHRVIRMEQVL